MAYGIDELIEQKTDAYRGNPAALAQKSKVSGELIDVLALQKITSTHDAAKRELQLQVENQPGTIAQQLEQKAMGQSKDDVLQGVAGVMKNNQARQQQNMQRVASQGVAAQPRPNMQTMAQGGIVGFQEGKQVESPYTGSRSKQREDIIRDLEAGKITQERADELVKALPIPRLGDSLEQLGRAATPQVVRDAYGNVEEFLFGTDDMQSPVQSVLRGADTLTRSITGGAEDLISGDYMKPVVDYLFTPTSTAPAEPEEPVVEPPVVPPIQQEQKQPAPEPEKDPLAEGIAALQQVKVAERGELDAGTRALDAQQRALASNLAAVDPKAERAEAANFANQELGRDQKAADYAEMQAKLEALNASQTAAGRNDRLIQTLLGASGSTVGEALKTSGVAGMAAKDTQTENERQRVMDELNLKSKAIDVDIDLGKTAVTAATAAAQQAGLDRREGSEALGKIVGKEKEILNQEVTNKLAADTANARTNLEKLKLMSESLNRKALRRSDDLNALGKRLDAINKAKLKTITDLREDPAFQTMMMQHAAIRASGDAEAFEKSAKVVNAELDRLYAQAEMIFAASGLATTRTEIERRVNEMLDIEGVVSGGIDAGSVQSITQKPTT